MTVLDARSVSAATLSRNEATLAVNAGGSLAVSGGFTFGGGTLTATGSMTVGGTFAISGNAKIDNTGGGLVLNGAFNWGSGSIVGGTVTASNGGVVTNGGIVDGAATVLKMAGGNWNWSNGQIQVNNGGTLQVESGGTLTITPNNAGFTSAAGGGTVTNFGTIQKTGGGGASAVDPNVTLNNAGTWRVTSTNGSWNIKGTVNNTGAIDIGGSSRVTLDANGTLNLNAGSSVTGSGQLAMTNSGGRINVNANVTLAGGLQISRGVTSGTGTLNVNGSFDFGQFDSNSLTGITVNAAGGGNWTANGAAKIGTATVNVTGGTVTWGTGTFLFTDNGALNIGAGGRFHTTGDGDITASAGKTPTITVSGTYAKTAGNGDALITAPIGFTVNSGGVVDSQIGTLTFQQTGLTSNGTIKASTGALVFNTATTFSGTGTLATDAGGTISVGPGTGNTVLQSGGTFTNNGTLNLNSGAFKVASAATVSNYNAGTTTLTGGVWNVSNATLDLDGRTVSNIAAGTTVTLSGTGNVTGLSSLNQVTGHLRILGGATLTPVAAVNNGGTVEVLGTFGGPMTVTSTGILTGSGNVNGTVTVQAGGEVSPGPGPLNLSGVKVLSTGTLNLNGGGRYTWEINSWATDASAGNTSNGFDQLRGGVTGAKLNLAGATAANKAIIKINSLNGSTLGQIANFGNTVARSWVIADFGNGNASGGVLNFSADKFAFDLTNFSNDLGGGTFAVSLSGNSNQLILSFTPVPEPATVVLVGAAGLAAVSVRRRTRG